MPLVANRKMYYVLTDFYLALLIVKENFNITKRVGEVGVALIKPF